MNFEERMATQEYQDDIVNVLNSIPEYLNGVSLCNYQRITINVTKDDQDWFSYTSFNDNTGAISYMKEGVHNPDIATSVESSVLEDILERKDELLAAPAWKRKFIVAKYARHFKMPFKDKTKILGTMTKNVYNSLRAQFSS